MNMQRLIVATTALALRVKSHAAMTSPAPRNAAGINPEATNNQCGASDPYSQANNNPGEYCGYGCTGDACLWYQIGCFAGCSNCSYQGKDLYPTAEDLELAGNCVPIEPTLPDEFRSYNIDSEAGSDADWTKVNPWRAPGTAGRGNPDFNPCGLNSGDKTGALPTATGYEDYLMVGTDLPAVQGATPAIWTRGSVHSISYGIYAHHAGGFSYRLCKKGADGFAGVTEECFQQNVLDFATNYTTVKYHDGSRDDFQIPAQTVSEGTHPANSQWRPIPVPMCNCDAGGFCQQRSIGMFDSYEETHLRDGQDTSEWGCSTGVQFETPWDEGYGNGVGSENTFGQFPWTLEDEVAVPKTLDVGEYVLSWRWDCEQTPQVWSSCADVSIVDSIMF